MLFFLNILLMKNRMWKKQKKGRIYNDIRDAFLEFEMFFLNLINNEPGVDLNDFFKFVAATNRIPMQGFGKPIETFFVDRDRY